MKQRPWNRVNLPVYSISTIDAEGKCNMNLCTYATQISMKPKLFAVAIYPNTKTFSNVQLRNEFLLQILSSSEAKLARLLGKNSGLRTDKHNRLASYCGNYRGFRYLKNALAYIHLKVVERKPTGDHHLYICELVAFKNLNEGVELTLNDLRKAGVIGV